MLIFLFKKKLNILIFSIQKKIYNKSKNRKTNYLNSKNKLFLTKNQKKINTL